MWKVICPRCRERIYLEDDYFKTRLSEVYLCPKCSFPIRIREQEISGNRIVVTRIGRKVA